VDQIQGGLTSCGNEQKPRSPRGATEDHEQSSEEPDEIERGLGERFMDDGDDMKGPGPGQSLAWLDDGCLDVPGLEVPEEED
jgi:hypothetical protein